MKQFDIIVIGSGGGSKICRPAANLGYKVAMIERGAMGGTCLNHGCIPSKMLIHPAELIHQIKGAEKFNINIAPEALSVDAEKLIARVTKTIVSDSDSVAPVYQKTPNVALFQGHGKFISEKVIEVNGEHLTAPHIVLTPGVRAHIPNIPGLEGTPYITHKEALRLTKKPKSMVVIGGGYIAVELGFFYAEMGTETTFLVRDRMIKAEDQEVIDLFEKRFSQEYPVIFGATPTHVSYENNTFTITYTLKNGDTKTIQSEALLLATGMIPNTDNLGLENTSIKTDSNGFIIVDDTLETNVEKTWAFGDVIGQYLFRHAANYQGEYLLKTMFNEDLFKPAIKYPPMPHAIFTHPQVAGVGLTEQEARAQHQDNLIIAVADYKNSGMGMALLADKTHGFCKLIYEKTSRKLIGTHIIGHEAATMIHTCIAFMKMGATIEDMLDTIYIHPALPEIVRNAVRKAAEHKQV